MRDKRLRTAGVIFAEKETIAIDAGPDFRQQMLQGKVNVLDAILFTHAHKDHIAGLDDVRAYNFLLKRDMPIYADAPTMNRLRQEFDYAFRQDYPGVPVLAVHDLTDAPFAIGETAIIPIPVWHGKQRIYGFRIGNFAYITDANAIPEASMALLQGVDTLVLNALRHEAHYSHFTLSEAVAVVEAIQPQRAYFTHISHLLGTHTETNAALPHHIQLAHDGLMIEIAWKVAANFKYAEALLGVCAFGSYTNNSICLLFTGIISSIKLSHKQSDKLKLYISFNLCSSVVT